MKVSELEWQFDRFVNLANCNGTSDAMSCLRSLDIETLQKANYGSPFPGQAHAPHRYFGPTVDGDMIQDYPSNLLAQGKFINVPLMVGDEPDEGTLFVTNASSPDDVAEFFTNNYPNLNSSETDAINGQYGREPVAEHAPYFGSLASAYGESTFICPGISLCEAMSAKSSSDVWNYSYNITTTQFIDLGLGVTHTIDTGAIFGPYYGGTPKVNSAVSYTTYNAAVVPILMDYYISFVKTLSPNNLRNTAAPEWPTYTSGSTQQRLLLNIDSTTTEAVPGSLLSKCMFWYGLADTMQH